MSVKDYTGIVVGIVAIGVAGFLAYKWLNPSTSTPTANNPFPAAGQIPIVPSDYHYVNPILCALGAKDFCPVTAPVPGSCITNVWDPQIQGLCSGGFNYSRGDDGCIKDVVCI